MSIDEVRAWFVGRGWGIAPADQLFYERLAGVLEEGEAPQLGVPITCDNAVGHAVLTDRRLVHIGTNLVTGMQVAAIPRADIQGASFGGLVLGKVTVKHAGGVTVFRGGKPQAKQLMAALGY